MQQAQIKAGGRLVRLASLAIQGSSFGFVLGDALAIAVQISELRARAGMSSVAGLREIGDFLGVVFGDTLAFVVVQAKAVAARGMSEVTRESVVLGSLHFIFCEAVA